jgi:hypothetical protein
LAEKLEREEKLARAKAALEKMNADRSLSWDAGGVPQQAQPSQQAKSTQATQQLPQAEREAKAREALAKMKAQNTPRAME